METMTEDFVRLNLDELDALKSALQLLSKKEQKLMESSGKVSFNRLYNKLQSAVDDIQRVVAETV
jgi:nicotinate-nucleotide pyrophosphorylase